MTKKKVYEKYMIRGNKKLLLRGHYVFRVTGDAENSLITFYYFADDGTKGLK